MKLIIRDEKEDTCEIWLEKGSDNIRVISQVKDEPALVEVIIRPNLKTDHIPNSNFKWDKE